MKELIKSSEKVRIIIIRLYGYLKRFKEDGIKISIFYVMSNIIFGDTKEEHQLYLREVVFKK